MTEKKHQKRRQFKYLTKNTYIYQNHNIFTKI